MTGNASGGLRECLPQLNSAFLGNVTIETETQAVPQHSARAARESAIGRSLIGPRLSVEEARAHEASAPWGEASGRGLRGLGAASLTRDLERV